jgi:hypothetical protein
VTNKDYEGSLVLERLAEAGLIDAFYEAVDSDDLKRAKEIMCEAGVDEALVRQTISVIKEES